MHSPKKKHPKVVFGEDMQTLYGKGWTGARALYAGYVGKDGRLGEKGWGAYEQLHPSEWENNLGENYRRCCTSVSWVGQALAARLMKAEKVWAHDAFFEYVDRWMFEDDTQAIEEIKKAGGGIIRPNGQDRVKPGIRLWRICGKSIGGKYRIKTRVAR